MQTIHAKLMYLKEIFETIIKLYLKSKIAFKEKVESLLNISAGDFATITRQARFSPIADSLDFYQRLVSESKIKTQESSKVMGFASSF